MLLQSFTYIRKPLVSFISLALLVTMGANLNAAYAGSSRHFPQGQQTVIITKLSGVRAELLSNIAPVIEKSIAAGYYPGAVILVAHRGQLIYQGVFGNRRIVPDIAPMREDTIFDLASLTKVIATAPAIMQLVEQGKINLDAPVVKYWPEFSEHDKNLITIRELLTHTSGLPADISDESTAHNKADVLKQIIQLKLLHKPGSQFLYSDVNFIVLAHLIEIITHESLDVYASQHIFKPLAMNNTYFNPPAALRDQIAPTEKIDNQLRWGQADDPLAHIMDGVSGNAGLFSTAPDLARFAQSMLDGGKLPQPYNDGKTTVDHFLGPLSIAKMTTKQTPADMLDARGLGWDIDSPYSNRGVLFPVQSYGHTGWTGTSIWIDPVTQTWIILLTSRLHPTADKSNQLIEDRRTIANIVSASIVDIANYSLNNTGKGELARAYARS